VLIRQTAPVFGAAGSSPYPRPGEWQMNISFRGLKSDTHYRLDERQVERETLGTYVINRQHALDVNATYAFSERFQLSAAVPFVNASWSIPSPTTPTPGPRAQEDGRGIGDISVSGRYWVLDTQTHRNANIAIGCGFKMPTGNYQAMDTFPDRNGQNNMPRYIDQSVQPGDGGWGLMFEVQGFKRIGRRAQIFGSGNYLANPRDTNGTPSLLVSRLPPGAPIPNDPRVVNSVPDQYLARVGGSMAIGKRIAVTTAYRVEGQRRYDLIGASHGFRRPGVSMFIEPGVTFASGNRTFSFTVPVAFYRNRKPDPYTGNRGDATFPRYIFLASYGWRFGGPSAPAGVRTSTAKPCN
jgi:hypothetical protein